MRIRSNNRIRIQNLGVITSLISHNNSRQIFEIHLMREREGNYYLFICYLCFNKADWVSALI